MGDDYRPFQGYSAWFSHTVQPDIIEQWGTYGGHYESQKTADYLFSENTYESETCDIYDNHYGLVVFRPQWIQEVIEARVDVGEVPIAPYLLCPHFVYPSTTPMLDHTPPLTRRPLSLPRLKTTGGQVTLGKLHKETGEAEAEEESSKHSPLQTKASEKGHSLKRAINERHHPLASGDRTGNVKSLKDIVHIDSLGPILMRLTDITTAQNLVIKKRKNSHH